MATSKAQTAAKVLPAVPAGVTVQMLARALFQESIEQQNLSLADRQQRWKAEGQTHLKRASRMIRRLVKMTAKTAV